ncbi:pyridoxamine kinase [Pseudoflavonifractor sp. BIOML-A6]|nr:MULTISPECIES: pyridoxamine kinase [unclassified Pseudoflavonifractor]MTQ97817.1 pyridoxamine kinase [Pseudoflavonifractor sp. BIOML-A16]MTR04503.1 pyridoxamine kinase [Pseudoflavonifractor sp. BIOML-A15]MTR33597.1 pyridoxamine kinase [Pseudoflavonifractor sp. BIOML-A14]MTR71814.1 pyridoxamine kinase [Pseudoflavonifractor sp. BIOML-A18]MTS62643.1 pyridoxamine kinase [Pseudoflavonifractor sp. BIOML-A5]MTS71763.1 pyridoxamine kinase [Pseudoflavonifractor sp. BIOML-A8]MTS89815.1 pyridoxamine 
MNAAPKVAAVHDLTGFGRCSLTVALPVLGAMGCQCCPVPTAYLSAHTGFPASERASFLDMTGQLPRTAEHWVELGVALDAIYSGFLSSAEQIGLLGEFIGRFRQAGTLVLVDPVMGDHGRAYRTYTGEMCEKMKSLCDRADLITPNLTEAALLLDEPYCASPGPDQVRRTLERLSLEGKRSVVITGVSAGEGQVGAACLDRETGRTCIAMSRREEGQYPGTGDLFASVLLGALLRGGELRSAAECAVEFVRGAVRRTLELGTPILEGVQFEGLLGALVNREEIT